MEVGLELIHDCASNWRRNITKSLKFRDKIPTNVYNNNTLRKCKQQKKDEILHITNKCPIMSLIELKYSVYSDSIHLIGADPLIVHYWTPYQLVVFKQLRKSYVRLAIDATGNVVKKIKRTKVNITATSHYNAVTILSYYKKTILLLIEIL